MSCPVSSQSTIRTMVLQQTSELTLFSIRPSKRLHCTNVVSGSLQLWMRLLFPLGRSAHSSRRLQQSPIGSQLLLPHTWKINSQFTTVLTPADTQHTFYYWLSLLLSTNSSTANGWVKISGAIVRQRCQLFSSYIRSVRLCVEGRHSTCRYINNRLATNHIRIDPTILTTSWMTHIT